MIFFANVKRPATYFRTIACFFLSILFISSPAFAQKAPYTIHLKSAVLNPRANARQWLEQKALQKGDNSPKQVLLQFEQTPTQEQKAELKAKGIQVLDYVNGNAYTAMISTSVSASAAAEFPLRSITDMQADWKAEIALWNRLRVMNNKQTEIAVAIYKDIKREEIQKIVTILGGSIIKTDMEKLDCYRVSIAANKVKELAGWYGVRYISPAAEYVPLDVEQNAAAGAAIVQAPISNGGYGMKGEGVTIGVGDNTSGIFHIDCVDRIINYHPNKYTNHGQHMNGIVGSAGILDPKSEGVVPHATMVDHIYDNILANTGVARAAHNMNITNNSYASVVGDTAFAGTYDVYSQAVDQLALQYTDVLHVFASGNDGYMARPPYPMTLGTVCGGYQPAKNNIVVTNSSKKLENRYEASKGPVKDGRLKPELSAIGNLIISTTRDNGYLVSGGTSMACPQVSGLAGLLTQRHKQLFGPANPRSDVLKVLLLNGAYDEGNAGPDYIFGYGMVDIHRSLEMLDSGRYASSAMFNTGGQQVSTITVPAGMAQLKVMLCYHDVPATLIAPEQLVNDLDLEVVEPNSTVHYPLVLNTDKPNVLDLAAEGRDSLNNTEQVTINNPPAGTYTIRVKGHDVPSGPVSYTLAWDWVPVGVKFKNPVLGTTQSTNDSLNVYWDASADPNPLTLEYSTNNGGSWTTIDNNIPANQKYYSWFVPNVSSEQCKLRIIRNTTSMQDVSGTFVINPKPVVYVDSTALCPGYIKINWSPVPNATGYMVMRKKGYYMQPEITVNDTTYTFTGLALDSTYYMAVQPLINGVPGYRSLGVFHQPASGTCPGSMSDGDLMVEKIFQPIGGRKLTNTQLGTNETMVVRVRNLDNVASGAYTLHYAVNGIWQTQTGTGIPANSSTNINITGLNLSVAGAYTLQAAIEHTGMTDNISANDSARKVVRCLNNNPASLTAQYVEGFENFNVLCKRDSMGISPDEHWDYSSNMPDSGRLRSYVNDSFVITGTRSITLDRERNEPLGTQNYLTGTFNFSAMDTASDEVRMEFDYMIHGKPKFYNGNQVWVRGSDNNSWLPLYHYDTAISSATIVNSGTISITQALKANGQNFSTSFQVRFGQNDTANVASKDYGNGMTIDNFKMYTLQKDMQMLSVLSPVKSACGIGNTLPVTIRVYNSVSQAQANTQVNYKYDNGTTVSETIANIAGNDTVDYTFNQTISPVTAGTHTIDVWLSAPGDGYLANDSIKNIVFHNQPVVTDYPSLENFESNNGYWYSEGASNSWEWGTPGSPNINAAFSGTKAWKTNLDGYYNNQELSYLYTNCFDISSLDSPMLSFKMIMDIENCGTPICDGAYMEYSYNGNLWTKLGAYGQGTNWYTDANYNVWTKQDSVLWRDATIPLPVSTQPIRFRYVFASDMATEREGLGIDDFRIYNYTDSTIAEDPFEGVAVYPNPANEGKVKVKWSAEPGTKMQVSITDVAGRIVFKNSIVAGAKVNETTLQTGKYMTGVYFVKVIVGGTETVKKVLFTQ